MFVNSICVARSAEIHLERVRGTSCLRLFGKLGIASVLFYKKKKKTNKPRDG